MAEISLMGSKFEVIPVKNARQNHTCRGQHLSNLFLMEYGYYLDRRAYDSAILIWVVV